MKTANAFRGHIRKIKVLAHMLLLLPLAQPVAALPTANDSTAQNVALISHFIAAFNAHDVDAMLELVHDDLKWFSMAGDSVITEASGKAQLHSGMSAYFSQISKVGSQIEEIFCTGQFVSFREKVCWKSSQGRRCQNSAAVYEILDNKICRVWYFPAQEE